MRLMVGIPTYGMPKCEFAIDSLGSLLFHLGRKYPDLEVLVQRDVRTYRQEARKAIIESAIENQCEYVLMLDDDHVFGGEEFDKLWESMQSRDDVSLVGGLYFTRGLPTVPCIFRLTAQGTVPIFYYPENELIEVDVIGFGFVLFKTEVFRKLNPPWFNLGIGFGEDAAFCARVLQSGGKVWAHTGAKVGHLLEQPHVITEADYARDRDRTWREVGTSQLVPAEIVAPLGQTNGLGKSPSWRPKSTRRGLWGLLKSRDKSPTQQRVEEVEASREADEAKAAP